MSLRYLKYQIADLEKLLHDEPLLAICGLLCVLATGCIITIVIDSILYRKKKRRNAKAYERYLRFR
ncbi:MAG: hypothetical protein JWR69_518 [Pedosphaera sp.]|nr:hypothetical protein [Pedosphaera sp.]